MWAKASISPCSSRQRGTRGKRSRSAAGGSSAYPPASSQERFAALVVAGRSGGLRRRGELSAQRLALELETMGIVDDAIEDGVGDGRLADDVVPAIDGDLAGDEGGAAAIALLDDLQQIAALVGGERLQAPVV